MDVNSKFATMVIADISGSTPLYKAVGDDEAQRLIQLEIDRLRSVMLEFGGIPVGQKGDDVLSYFDDPNAAVHAALRMIERPDEAPVTVHVGVHSGPIVVAERGIYGEAVNVTARLSTAANPREACISDNVASMLSPELLQLLKPLGGLSLKGLTEPVTAYSLVNAVLDPSTQTRLPLDFGRTEGNLQTGDALTLILSYKDRAWRCRNDGEFKLGRSSDCDVVLPQPWVSRLHAVLSMKSGKLFLTDRSTSGTYVKSEGGQEIQLKRETIMLTSSGLISPTLPIEQSEACLRFDLIGRPQVPQNVA